MSTWPRIIYVATSSLGVYVTEDFTDPAVQPSWTAINTGLGTLALVEFWLDPFEPRDRQYVLTGGADKSLYMRVEGGPWVAILTAAEAVALAGSVGTVTTRGFCTDPSIAGRLWVTIGRWDNAPANMAFAAYTDDYGDNWTVVTQLWWGTWLYQLGSVRAYGDNVYVAITSGLGGFFKVMPSDDKGANWLEVVCENVNALWALAFNKLQTTQVWTRSAFTTNDRLTKVTNAGIKTTLQDNMGVPRYGAMWFHPTDPNHQRIWINSRLHTTLDSWATEADSGVVASTPLQFSPYSGTDPDASIVGLTLGTHVIGTLDDEADTTPTGIAGANAGTAPYTDSIPKTCGGLAAMGIQAVDLLGKHTFIYLDGGAFEEPAGAGVHLTGGALEEPADAGVHLTGGALEEPT